MIDHGERNIKHVERISGAEETMQNEDIFLVFLFIIPILNLPTPKVTNKNLIRRNKSRKEDK